MYATPSLSLCLYLQSSIKMTGLVRIFSQMGSRNLADFRRLAFEGVIGPRHVWGLVMLSTIPSLKYTSSSVTTNASTTLLIHRPLHLLPSLLHSPTRYLRRILRDTRRCRLAIARICRRWLRDRHLARRRARVALSCVMPGVTEIIPRPLIRAALAAAGAGVGKVDADTAVPQLRSAAAAMGMYVRISIVRCGMVVVPRSVPRRLCG